MGKRKMMRIKKNKIMQDEKERRRRLQNKEK